MKLRQPSYQRFKRAFTLIEVMVSLAILAVLFTIGLYNYRYMLSTRRQEADYKAVGQLFNLAKDQARSMGSTPGGAPNPAVYVSLMPAPCKAATVGVYYQGLNPCAGGGYQTKPLEIYTLNPCDTLSASPAVPCKVLLNGSGNGQALQGLCGGTVTGASCPTCGKVKSVRIMVVSGAACQCQNKIPFKVFRWDTYTGGVTFCQ